mmetsp:Transcript_13100/g.30604  ORF Transcript_13100/g.30604 Transcript_13100/m.30604 type:complete len:636 (+) Transcript_13100:110-2017(+)|eukprot:CAMPEP_0178431756 /NCGR_PEP_ID=MMETSP0689_2-20121128/32025_1 /TAXON_ID=160604 /ORGANISM="Amphidinium massartii, Strain CS-259" /LENGTH=635 /DNA_ID=CAMNT_0020053705 /DNA_START=32 /DNA_END=1939 /DNA_ORIENTATION=+
MADDVCTEKARIAMLKAAERARDAGLSLPLVRMAITGLELDDDVTEGLSTLSRRAIYAEQCSFFLVYSSTSALMGLSRSSDYAACNGLMDNFLPHRKAMGLQMFSTRWGEVLGTGLADAGLVTKGMLTPWEKSGITLDGKFQEYKKFYIGMLTAPPNPKQDQIFAPIMTQLEAKNHRLRVQCFEKAEELYRVPEEDEDLPPTCESMRPAVAKLRVVECNIAAKQLEKGAAAVDSKGFAKLSDNLPTTTKSSRDRILLLGSLPVAATGGAQVAFAFKRSTYPIGPSMTSYVGGYAHNLMAWVDKPCENSDYEIQYRCDGPASLSTGSLATVAIPGEQVTSSKSRLGMAVETSRWYNVPGMQQVSIPGPGERVLIICTLTCTPKWDSSMARGLFRIMRDGVPLDLGLGVQSVQSTRQGTKRTITLCMLDNPEPGLHLYMVQSIVVTNGPELDMYLEDNGRQLSLIRLPSSIVVGPKTVYDQTAMIADKDAWTPVEGLSVTVDVKSANDKVLIVYNTNCSPFDGEYEAYFTLMRTTASQSSAVNLGDKEQGTWMVSSQLQSSSEYPMGMLLDTPGAGVHSYQLSVKAKKAQLSVGPDGRIGAVVLPARHTDYDAPEKDSVLTLDALKKVQEKLMKRAG